eukprot:scaffold3385_cov241-Pinguiococcus_pyrenoidosus.AAC.3
MIVLRTDADDGLHVVVLGLHIEALDVRLAVRGVEGARQAVDQGRLTSPVMAQQREDLILRDRQRHLLQRCRSLEHLGDLVAHDGLLCEASRLLAAADVSLEGYVLLLREEGAERPQEGG